MVAWSAETEGYRIPPLVFMEDYIDLEGVLRFLALLESIKALEKASVWTAKSRGRWRRCRGGG